MSKFYKHFSYTCNENGSFSLIAYLTIKHAMNFPLLISLTETSEAAAGNWVTFEQQESEAYDAECAL